MTFWHSDLSAHREKLAALADLPEPGKSPKQLTHMLTTALGANLDTTLELQAQLADLTTRLNRALAEIATHHAQIRSLTSRPT